MHKIEIVYCGIDTKKFHPKKIKRKGKFTVFFPSRISPEKGQHVAISALKLLPKEILKNIQLVLVGFVSNKDYLEKLTSLASKLPVEIKINVPDIVSFYHKSDMVIYPTLMRDFGLVAGEAMACEKPLVVSDFPAVRELVGKKALLIKLGDSKALADSIEKIYLDKNLRKRLISGSRERILRLFSWDKTFEGYSKIYDSFKRK